MIWVRAHKYMIWADPYKNGLLHRHVSYQFETPMLSNSPLFAPSRFIKVTASMNPQQPDPPKKRVLVCGGGVIGVCTAYFLSKKGAAVTLVEQSSIACAASGKAGGFLALDWCDGGPVSSLARASFNLHRSLAQELDGTESYGYRALNTLSLSVTESEKVKRGRKSSVPEWIDGPVKSPRTIGMTETTAQVHPHLFTRKLMEKAVAEFGVEVVTGKVKSVETGVGKVTVLVEGGGVFDGDAVVLALGPWMSKFELLSSLIRVHGLKAHSLVLEPKDVDAISADALFLSYLPAHGGQPMDPEIYPRPTGEVYICGMSSQEEVPDDPEQIEPNPDSIRVLKRVAGTVSSHLGEESRVKAEQACFLPCTDDNIPVIGEVPGMKGCYVATGHSCWGILNGPATGAAMAELVMDGCSTIVDLTRFSPARFVRK
ncbi:putative D-amino-acid oxidase [Helianthus annuus]|uniref:D-amino-acid oxidase n=2 Tax=Helianthus annuus TaxID=4232 RepID=A0A251T3P2_HELAN|nr:putative D-amino-acid oxidase [Helianthus annuus]KAJ0490205.1 putative D-amino-acid oxidase [Helianthus annuus]KAJ0494344.1 putative D-amino-acid oxidase [Helianthus annuus]KAJ0506123.1 putative D-amino-acid oxidase [Helianthus annuus]KAJ0675794.1 putative D-amino-acid oxidase [Helianthus annuus]